AIAVLIHLAEQHGVRPAVGNGAERLGWGVDAAHSAAEGVPVGRVTGAAPVSVNKSGWVHRRIGRALQDLVGHLVDAIDPDAVVGGRAGFRVVGGGVAACRVAGAVVRRGRTVHGG